MTPSEQRKREEYTAMLLEKITNGEITPEEAEIEWDYHFNGTDSRENLCGW